MRYCPMILSLPPTSAVSMKLPPAAARGVARGGGGLEGQLPPLFSRNTQKRMLVV